MSPCEETVSCLLFAVLTAGLEKWKVIEVEPVSDATDLIGVKLKIGSEFPNGSGMSGRSG